MSTAYVGACLIKTNDDKTRDTSTQDTSDTAKRMRLYTLTRPTPLVDCALLDLTKGLRPQAATLPRPRSALGGPPYVSPRSPRVLADRSPPTTAPATPSGGMAAQGDGRPPSKLEGSPEVQREEEVDRLEARLHKHGGQCAERASQHKRTRHTRQRETDLHDIWPLPPV
jgi:hypothetical protein